MKTKFYDVDENGSCTLSDGTGFTDMPKRNHNPPQQRSSSGIINTWDLVAATLGLSYVLETMPQTPSLVWAATAAALTGAAIVVVSKAGAFIGASTAIPADRNEPLDIPKAVRRANLGRVAAAVVAAWLCHVTVNEIAPRQPPQMHSVPTPQVPIN